MPGTSILIARPLDDVWSFLTSGSNWQAWYEATPTVAPGWQRGATIMWPNGDRSMIEECVEGKILRYGSTFVRTTIELAPQGEQTQLHYSFEARGGASFSDGGAAVLATFQQKLLKMKGILEG